MRDLIDRQAAIDAIERIGSLDTEADKKYARSVFEALPSAQRWIPVSERLPEEDTDVLVSVHFDVSGVRPGAGWYVDIASKIDGHWVSYSDEYKIAKDFHKVVAWMPLPKPWKGEEDADKE